MTDAMLSELAKYLLPLVSVAVGWGLNEASQSLKLRRESRRAVGRALTSLIYVRHSLLGIEYIIETLSRFGMPSEHVPAFKALVFQQFPEVFGGNSLHSRYQEAVDVIAGEDPILAFRLQQRDMVTLVLNRVRTFAAQEAPLAAAWGSFEPELIGKFVPILEELILELAWAHSYKTWFRARRSMKASLPASTEVDDLLKSFLAGVEGKSEPEK